MKRHKPLSRRTPPRKRGRSKSEYARIYGSRARVAFVKRLPCAACGAEVGCDNHHTENGGLSRKGDYTTIVPLCWWCHRLELPYYGTASFERRFGINLKEEAAKTEKLWQSHQEEGKSAA